MGNNSILLSYSFAALAGIFFIKGLAILSKERKGLLERGN